MLGKGRLFGRSGRRRRTRDMPADSPKNAVIGFWNEKTDLSDEALRGGVFTNRFVQPLPRMLSRCTLP